MAAANTSKSLVHIQEKFARRGRISATVAVPSTASTVTGITVTGVKVGDTVFAQPATASDVVAGVYVTSAYVTAANTIAIVFAGSGTGASKTYSVTVLAADF
jgi:hypothetical protein